MRTTNLLEDLKFGGRDPHAEVVHSDLKGKGTFAGGDGVEHACGPNTPLVFDARENHTIHALEELVFVGVLHGAPLAQK